MKKFSNLVVSNDMPKKSPDKIEAFHRFIISYDFLNLKVSLPRSLQLQVLSLTSLSVT